MDAYQRPSRGPFGPSGLEVCVGVMTLGWFAISGRGASTTFEVGSGAFATDWSAGLGAGVAAGAGEAAGAVATGATESRPVDSWLWAQKAVRK
jgi:hypothetical protein